MAPVFSKMPLPQAQAQRLKLTINTNIPADHAGDSVGSPLASPTHGKQGYEKSAKHMEAISSTNWRATAHPNTASGSAAAVFPAAKTVDLKVPKRVRGQIDLNAAFVASDDGSVPSSAVDTQPHSPTHALTFFVPVHRPAWSRVSSAPYWNMNHGHPSMDEITREVSGEVDRAYDSCRHANGIPTTDDLSGLGSQFDHAKQDKAPASAPAAKASFSVFDLLGLETGTTMDFSTCPVDYECNQEVAAIRNSPRTMKVRTLNGAIYQVVDREVPDESVGTTPHKHADPCVVYEVLPSTMEYENETCSAAKVDAVGRQDGDFTDGVRASVAGMAADLSHGHGNAEKADTEVPASLNDPAILSARKAAAPPASSAADKARFQGLLTKLADSARDKFFKAIELYRDPISGAGRPTGTDPVDEAFSRFMNWVQVKYREFFRSGCVEDMLRMLESVDSTLTHRIAVMSGKPAPRGGRFGTAHVHSASTDSTLNPKAREFLSHESPRKSFSRPSVSSILSIRNPTPPPSAGGSPPLQYLLVPFPCSLPGQPPLPHGLQPLPFGLPQSPPMQTAADMSSMAPMAPTGPFPPMSHMAPPPPPMDVPQMPQTGSAHQNGHYGLGIHGVQNGMPHPTVDNGPMGPNVEAVFHTNPDMTILPPGLNLPFHHPGFPMPPPAGLNNMPAPPMGVNMAHSPGNNNNFAPPAPRSFVMPPALGPQGLAAPPAGPFNAMLNPAGPSGQNAIRPLPVRLQPLKPQGYSNTNGQQGYEAWIEHRKANDPEYALKCKLRQQKRHLRQQMGGLTARQP